jgi:hypothetical protein
MAAPYPRAGSHGGTPRREPYPLQDPHFDAEMTVLRWLDLAVLAVALPVFIALDAPILGYAVAGGAWLVGRGIHLAAQRRAKRELARGNRRGAVGLMGAVTLGRVWLVALSVLIVGLAEREAGLAAALLAAALFTAYLAGVGLSRLLDPEANQAPGGSQA